RVRVGVTSTPRLNARDRAVSRRLRPSAAHRNEPPVVLRYARGSHVTRRSERITMTDIYRQGDVLIQRVACIPASTAPVERVDGRIILAEGELTGHHHAIA